MATTENVQVQIKGQDDTTSAGALRITHYEKNERLKRALMALGLFWLLAVLSLPIVIAHWVLVPGFFIAGPIMAYKRYNMSSAKENVSGECPQCHNQITIDMEPAEQLPKWTYCPSCNKSLQLIE